MARVEAVTLIDRTGQDRPADRQGTAQSPAERSIGFLLLPNFSLAAFAAALEPLELANRQAGRPLYDHRVLSHDGATVTASDGVQVRPDGGLTADSFDRIVLCGGFVSSRFQDPATFAWLRQQARRGTPIGGLSDATFVLAQAGLLRGRRATVHWHCWDSMAETFPDQPLGRELFVLDGQIFTCAGGLAALDLTLTLIATEHGRAFAERLAMRLSHIPIRDAGTPQRMATPLRMAAGSSALMRTMEFIEQQFDQELTTPELARQAGVTERQLQRLFRQRLGCTPLQHLQATRLHRAREMLAYTDMAIVEVAVACGFTSASHFARAYRRRYGQPPAKSRSAAAALPSRSDHRVTP